VQYAVRLATAVLLSIYLFAGAVFAEERTTNQTTDLSYLFSEEELFISATQSARKLNQAPAIATVITEKHLRDMGARSLMDALTTVPGFGITYPSEFAIENTFEVRGIKTAEAEKILLMIDGHPLNNAFSGSWAQVFDEFPVDSVKRIEIIRGPGSALYGANAFVAVINIIMKTPGELAGLRTTLATGDDDQARQSVEGGFAKGEFSLAGSFDHFSTRGSREFVRADVAGRSGRTNFWRNTTTNYVSSRYRDLRFTAVSVHKEKGSPLTITNRIDTATDWFARQTFAELAYGATVSGIDLELKIAGDFLTLDPDLQLSVPGFAEFSNPRLKTKSFTPRFKAVFPPIADNHITVGVEYQDIKQYDVRHFLDGVDVSPALNHNQEVSRSTYALYVQDEWDLNSDMILTAGVRLDHYSDFGTTINPRLAFVWTIQDRYDVKLLYGRAFRAPTFLELYEINNPSAVGNPDLDPEIMNTYEVGVSWRITPGYTASADLFYNRFTDRIVRRAPMSVNEGGANIRGIETEFKVDIRESLYGYINYAFQETEDRETNEELPDVPRHRLKVGVNAGFLNDGLNANAALRWTGERPRMDGDSRDVTKANTVVDLALRANGVFVPSLDLTLKIHNLFDEDVFDPSPPEVPDGFPRPGRTWLVEGSYRF